MITKDRNIQALLCIINVSVVHSAIKSFHVCSMRSERRGHLFFLFSYFFNGTHRVLP
jgi:hypothetical protein